MAPALSGDECRSWAEHPVMLARVPHHHGTAEVHLSRPVSLGTVAPVATPAVNPEVKESFESAPGR